MSTPAQPSRLPSQELQEILAANANGQQADLTGQDLQGMVFVGCKFAGAKVSGADFRDSTITPEQALTTKGWLLARWSPAVLDKLGLPTDHNERVQSKNFRGCALHRAPLNDLDLSGAILAEATLDKADLTGSNLEFAHLEEASLRNADLTNTWGLNAYQLRGADLTLAKLPPDIADSLKTLPGVDEATKTSRKVFLTMLAACLYCWLTILSTTDAGLLIGSQTLALPIVQTPIPVIAFFGAAPVLLLIVYLYLHFSLQNLWDALATLPAFFPDGRPVHERALPWILSPIVRLYFKRLVPFCTRLARFQVRATSLLVWWGIPFTLIAFLLRFLVRHDRRITILHVVIAGLSVWLSAMFWRITKDTLRGIPPARRRWLKVLLCRETLMGVLAGTLLALFSAGCFYGEPPYDAVTGKPYPWGWRTAAPNLLGLLGWNAFGNLYRADLSRKPDDWDGKDLDAVKGAQLQGRVLRAVNASFAFGPKANFRRADLSQAHFDYADLLGADLTFAQLEQAAFDDADLRSSDIGLASAGQASFVDANIEGADFRFVVGSLAPDQIKRARNWFLANLSDKILGELKVCDPDEPCDHEDRLSRKDFSGIDLTKFKPFKAPDFSGANLQNSILSYLDLAGADLSKTDLRHADLFGTRLDQANLTGADLRGVNLKTVRGLTRGQIESALTDEKTKLPPDLEAQKPFTPKK